MYTATAFVLALTLSACASMTSVTTLDGVTISDEERAACNESRDCTVWTAEELQKLGLLFFKKGYAKRSEELEI